MNCLNNETKKINMQEIADLNGYSNQNLPNDPSLTSPIMVKAELVDELIDIKPADMSIVKEELCSDDAAFSNIADDPENSTLKYTPIKAHASQDHKALHQFIKEEVSEVVDLPHVDVKLELTDKINEPVVTLLKYSCDVCNMTFLNQQIQKMHFNICHSKVSVPTRPDTTAKFKYNSKYKRFSLATRKKLIECVRNYPCLYDTENEDFNNEELHTLTWVNIASECNLPNGLVAKAEWKNLKTRLINAIIDSNASTRTQKQWQYKKQMEFVLPYLTDDDINSVPRNVEPPVTEIQENDENSDYYSLRPVCSTQNETTPNSKRKRQESVEPSTSSDTQPLDMFFLSMCATTKNLPSYVQLQVKKKIFQAVIEAEEIVAAMHNDQAENNIFSGTVRTGNQYENNLSPFSIQSNLEEDWQRD